MTQVIWLTFSDIKPDAHAGVLGSWEMIEQDRNYCDWPWFWKSPHTMHTCSSSSSFKWDCTSHKTPLHQGFQHPRSPGCLYMMLPHACASFVCATDCCQGEWCKLQTIWHALQGVPHISAGCRQACAQSMRLWRLLVSFTSLSMVVNGALWHNNISSGFAGKHQCTYSCAPSLSPLDSLHRRKSNAMLDLWVRTPLCLMLPPQMLIRRLRAIISQHTLRWTEMVSFYQAIRSFFNLCDIWSAISWHWSINPFKSSISIWML